MQKTVIVDDICYEVIKNYKDAFQEDLFLEKVTSYFLPYDYIVGDIAYNKLRLKGFYDKTNNKAKKINNYVFLEKYLKENCAVDCRYFVLKKKEKK